MVYETHVDELWQKIFLLSTDLKYIVTKCPRALTGLDRESAHPLQLHAVKRSCCTAANLGAIGRLSP